MSSQTDLNSDSNVERRRAGGEVVSQVVGARGESVIESLNAVNPALAHQVISWFGDSYARPGLDARSRQLVTLGALATLGGTEPKLRLHINTSLNVGITREEILEVFLHAAAYAGFPRAINATLVAREVFADLEPE